MVKNRHGQSGFGTLKLAVSRMNWLNELIICMLVQIQESKKLFQWFVGGQGQKWVWPLSSWDLKICFILRMSLWIELIFLCADCDSIIFG